MPTTRCQSRSWAILGCTLSDVTESEKMSLSQESALALGAGWPRERHALSGATTPFKLALRKRVVGPRRKMPLCGN
jgi:hypothetical protein